jgi:PAT family beta-lactamase induction signal transducer AmpG
MTHGAARGGLLHSRNGRFLAFGLLYAGQGIPYGFTSITMVALLRQQGVSLEQIGAFVAALVLPWALKWVWAPLIDLIKLPRLGGRKGWIVACTAMMIVALLGAAWLDFGAHFHVLMALVVFTNFLAATQDVAVDSLAVSTLQPDERCRASGFMFAGQFGGIALGGGGAMFVNGSFGFDAALAAVSGLLCANLLFVVLYVSDPLVEPAPVRQPGALRALVAAMISFVKEVYDSFWRSGRGPRIATAFALLPCGAMALAYATLNTIQVDFGLSDHQIAALSTSNILAGALGCVAGGWLGDRYGAKKMVALSYALTTLPTLLLALQISAHGLEAIPIDVFRGLVIAHGVFFGLTFGLRAAIFMGVTNPAVAATQFTAFMGMTNVAISIGNYWQGVVAERMGYAVVLYVDALLALLVILVIPFLRDRESSSRATTASPLPSPSPA